MTDTENLPTEIEQEWSSTLPRGRERFLAHVVAQGLELGQRTAKDFLRHFPPMAIMEALKDHPRLRADILAFTTGTKQRIAMKKSWESCGEDVEIALAEGATDASAVVDMFEADDRVRYLSAQKLWAYIVEGEFWKVSANRKTEQMRARAHVAYMIERALVDKLVTQQQIVEALTLEEIALRLPKQVLCEVLARALSNGRATTPFTEIDLLEVVPASVLVEHIPLTLLWDNVIVPLARKHGYVDAAATAAAPANDIAPAVDVAANRADSSAGVDRAGVDRAGVDRAGVDRSSVDRASVDRVATGQTGAAEVPDSGQSGRERSVVGAPSSSRASSAGGRDTGSRWGAAPAAPNQSAAGFKVPAPASPAPNGGAVPELTVWSAEVNEDDLFDEEESAEVVNS